MKSFDHTSEIQIGDNVRVVAGSYSITQVGSEGIVKAIFSEHTQKFDHADLGWDDQGIRPFTELYYYIEFYKLPSALAHIGPQFYIRAVDVKRIE
jgi:hypothetical protein